MKVPNDVFYLTKRIAQSYHKSTGLEFDDLYSEGLLGYCLHAHKYNPEKSKLTTFFYHIINNHLKDYVKKQEKQITITHKIETINFQIDNSFYIECLKTHKNIDKFIMDAI